MHIPWQSLVRMADILMMVSVQVICSYISDN